MQNQRVIFYIDGFNLYYGIDYLNINRYKWLDIQKLSEILCGTNQQLVKVKYFTSRVRNDPAKIKRQNTYLQAVETSPLVEIFYGSYILTSKDFNCVNCLCLNTVNIPKEKRTDINIVSQLFSDFYYDNCDTARIISGDSDLVPAIKIAKSKLGYTIKKPVKWY
ncbi:MAG: NYN domain-containing protein [Actinobacteria bacterium]|nr:NYN domain-containing protein [Actinomycetota bacterium]